MQISFYEAPLFYSGKPTKIFFSYMESRSHIRIEMNPLKYQMSKFWSLYKGLLICPLKNNNSEDLKIRLALYNLKTAFLVSNSALNYQYQSLIKKSWNMLINFEDIWLNLDIYVYNLICYVGSLLHLARRTHCSLTIKWWRVQSKNLRAIPIFHCCPFIDSAMEYKDVMWIRSYRCFRLLHNKMPSVGNKDVLQWGIL
jgi:hypothetical protein